MKWKESLPDYIKGVAGFGESRGLAIGSVVHSNRPTIPMCRVQVQLDMVCL